MALLAHPTNDVSGLVIGAAIDVHRALGPGLLESAYQTCLGREFTLRALEYEAERSIPVTYKGKRVDCGYRLDFIVERRLVVEVKSVERILPIHEAQVLTYLKLLRLPAGLLINFNVKALHTGVRRLLA
jgi:GxxExxY protein